MIELKAYAKINIGLRILKKREDGFHDIETVFYRVQPCDEISFEEADNIQLACNNPEIPNDESNLCYKAALLLQKFAGVTKGVSISLKKNIPVGAGLGGGSSDAAAALLGLVRFWNIKISDNDLQSLALKLGSDVPYFLRAGTAHATGRGEVLDYFDLEVPYWIVVVYPSLQVSTAWAYKTRQDFFAKTHAESNKPDISLKQILLQNISQPEKLNLLIQNDFEQIVFPRYDLISNLKRLLYQHGSVFAQMSGSGSAVYGFFKTESDALSAAAKVDRNFQVFITPPNFNPPD